MFGDGGGNFHTFGGNGKHDGVRALVGKLRDAADSVAEFGPLKDHSLVVLARKNCFVIRELAGEDAGDQEAMADLKEKMAFALRESQIRIEPGPGGKRFGSVHGFRGERDAHYPA